MVVCEPEVRVVWVMALAGGGDVLDDPTLVVVEDGIGVSIMGEFSPKSLRKDQQLLRGQRA